MPAKEWGDVLPIVSDDDRPTNNLKCSTCRPPAWKGVEFLDCETLVQAWLPRINCVRRASPDSNPVDLSNDPRPPIPARLLKEYMVEIRQKGGPVPAADPLVPSVRDA